MSLDLREAYLHVLIHSSHCRDLQFTHRKPLGELISLSMEGSPFWLIHWPQSFYQTPGSCSDPPASVGMSHALTWQHLSCSGVHQPGGHTHSGPKSLLSRQTQVCQKPSEVGLCHVSGQVALSWGLINAAPAACFLPQCVMMLPLPLNTTAGSPTNFYLLSIWW